jgi:hypothetical protein
VKILHIETKSCINGKPAIHKFLNLKKTLKKSNPQTPSNQQKNSISQIHNAHKSKKSDNNPPIACISLFSPPQKHLTLACAGFTVQILDE